MRHLLCGSYDFSGSLHGILHSDPPDGHADGNSGGVFVGAGASHGRSVPSGSIYTAGSSSFDAVSWDSHPVCSVSASDSGQKYLSASTSSILLSFESVFGLLFSVWLLHEELTVRMLIGCGLMFAAAILAELDAEAEKELDEIRY